MEIIVETAGAEQAGFSDEDLTKAYKVCLSIRNSLEVAGALLPDRLKFICVSSSGDPCFLAHFSFKPPRVGRGEVAFGEPSQWVLSSFFGRLEIKEKEVEILAADVLAKIKNFLLDLQSVVAASARLLGSAERL